MDSFGLHARVGDALVGAARSRRSGNHGARYATLATVTALVLAGLLLMAGIGIPFEERFIYFPSRALVARPADVGLPFEEVRFGADGRLHGWFVPGSRDVTVLWFHGNAGNISHRVELLAHLHHGLGVQIFIFDYQGYGLSGGRPTERGTYEDARAALAYLRTRPEVHPERIVYFGKSLGGAVAVELATAETPYRLIIQSSFTRIRDLARLHYPLLPVHGLLRTGYPSIERVGSVRAPILVAHGDADDVVPVDHARRLYEAAAEPKLLEVVPGARHPTVLSAGGERYLTLLRAFLGLDGRS